MKHFLSILFFAAAGHCFAADDTAFLRAQALFNGNRFADAEAVLESVVAQEPQNAEAHYLLARAMMDRGYVYRPGEEEAKRRFKQVREHLATAHRLDPKNINYARDYGYSVGDGIFSIRKAKKLVEAAYELDHNDPEVNLGLWNINKIPIIGDREISERHWQVFKSLDPERAFMIELEDFVYGKKDYTAAWKKVGEIETAYPGSAFAAFAFARVACEANEHLEKALAGLYATIEKPFPASKRVSPFGPWNVATSSYAWEHIGKLERALGRPEKARAAFAKGFELDPSNHWAEEQMKAVTVAAK